MSSSLKEKAAVPGALWIPLAYAVIMVPLSRVHGVFSEWGGVMQYFSGKEILAGKGYHGWTSHFWPPLYPFLLGLASTVMDGFFAGKLLSILAASGLLFASYKLANLMTGEAGIGLWTQVFMATNPIFFYESLQAQNHMLDAFCFVSGVLLFLKSLENPGSGKLIAAGVVCGLAGLTRYQSYILLFMPLSLFLFLRPKRAAAGSLLFYAGFGLINLPWWTYNAVQNGSPLHSWNYMNVYTGATPSELDNSLRALWRCAGMKDVNGVLDVLIGNPISYIRNVLHNLIRCVEALVKYGGALLLFVIPALFEGFVTLKREYTAILFAGIALSVGLVSQAYVASWYLLNWIAVINILCVAFFFRYFRRLQERFVVIQRFPLRGVCILLLIFLNLTLTGREARDYAREKTSYRPLAEAHGVSRTMRKHDPHLDSKTVMAIDPARAFYAGSNYLMTPLEYNGSVEGLVSYRDLDDRYKDYAPRYPSQMSGSELKADYLVYTRTLNRSSLLQDLPEFSFLLDPGSEKIPKSFGLVYRSQEVVVYEIR